MSAQLSFLAAPPARSPVRAELAHVYARPDEFRPDFAEWLVENVRIWRAFCARADMLIGRGFKHFSADAIFHNIRWETCIAERRNDYKLNDHWTSDCARLWTLMHPAHTEFFRTRSRSVTT